MTVEGTKIELPLLNIDKVRSEVELTEHYLILGENYIEYHCIAACITENDDTAIMEDKKFNELWCRPRRNLSSVELTLNRTFKCWELVIDFMGIARDGHSYQYLSKKAAMPTYEKLKQYMINTNA